MYPAYLRYHDCQWHYMKIVVVRDSLGSLVGVLWAGGEIWHNAVLYHDPNYMGVDPKGEYVGLTTRAFRKRLGEHKQNVRRKNIETPRGFHFNLPDHDVSHLAGLVLEKVKSNDPFVLRAREFLYIQKFDCYRNGLNKEP